MNDNSPSQVSTEAVAAARAHEVFRQWWFSFAVMVLIVITAFLSPDTINALALIPAKVQQGEWWRLLTGQYVHVGINHTLLNIMGYLIIATAFREDVSPKEEAVALLLSNLGVGLGIQFISTDIQWYAGLSGAIYGLLTHNLIVGWRRTPILSLLFGLYLLGKFYYEQFIAGPDEFTAAIIGAKVAIDSHLYGAVTGLVTGLISFFVFHRPDANGSQD